MLYYTSKNWDEADTSEILGLLSQFGRDILANSARFRSAVYLIVTSFACLLAGPMFETSLESKKVFKDSIVHPNTAFLNLGHFSKNGRAYYRIGNKVKRC